MSTHEPTANHSMTKGKVALVPFPFDDLTASKVRPAVCLTDPIASPLDLVSVPRFDQIGRSGAVGPPLFPRFQIERITLWRDAVLASDFSHPVDIAVALLNCQIKVHAGQFLAERPDMEIPLDLA